MKFEIPRKKGNKIGPLLWPDEYASCNGDRQSPININLPAALHLSKEYNLIFKRHNILPNRMLLKNTGRTVVVKAAWNNGKRPTIKGGILDGEYIFHEIHFHWGATNFEPSEHLINGYSFPLEMHLVHYKKKYETIKNAKDYNDGLAIVAYVFEAGDVDNPILQNIIGNLPNIPTPSSSPVELTPFKISKLAPMFNKDFATYQGSLTMPPCSEIVIWILYLKPLKASCDQVEQFRLIQDRHENLIKRNFRPVQRLNGRKILIDGQNEKPKDLEGCSKAIFRKASNLVCFLVTETE
ncbi:hypothetical protein J437_LFUL012802 [Ladona fulva]|uniref:Carbonic anhydrase n=1 Tax=Ladona fulva TaxID=123851 RepID=A0A8K0KMI2_LADFU|nr:hypothetical protein J437_LFUL012802 [Ladona fulva]